jgi:hypothetical protein
MEEVISIPSIPIDKCVDIMLKIHRHKCSFEAPKVLAILRGTLSLKLHK